MHSAINTISRFSYVDVALILCAIIFAGLIRIPSITQPLGPDQGIMSVIGEGILNGNLPYRDYWEMGSPAVFFTYALMFRIFGQSMSAIPITDILMSMLTTFLIFLLARSIWGKKVGFVSASLFAFFSNGVQLGMHAGGDTAFGTFWYIAQRETFMLPLIVASVFCLLCSERKDWNLLLLLCTGFFSGLAFVYKFPSIIIFACFIVYINWNFLSKKNIHLWNKLIVKHLFIIIGFVLALVPFAIFFSVNGAMREMTDVIFKFVFSIYGQIEHNYLAVFKMGATKTFLIAQENFILWIFALSSCIYFLKNERRKENMLIALWSLASILFVVSHREFFGYHYLLVLPPFSMLAGYGLVRALGPSISLRQTIASDFGKTFIILAMAANFAFFTTLNYMHYTKFYYYFTGKITQDEYYDFFNAYPKHDYSFPANYQVAQYVSENSDSTEMIYVLGGTESVIYFLSRRRSPSRFIFSWILFSSSHGQVEQAVAYRSELLHDLEACEPKFIVSIRSIETYQQYPEIYNFVKHNYVLDKIFPDDRFIYILKEHESQRI
ncbi:glycosyltransferase family 39 protein [Acidobacteriota bacterium]